MQTKNKSKKRKIILLLLLVFSTIFMIGCSTKGQGDVDYVLYDFCAGKYFDVSSSQGNDLIYCGVNQSDGSGELFDTNKNSITGSSFKPCINATDDRKYISDGFVETGDSNLHYVIGTYTFKYSKLKQGNLYYAYKYLSWDNMPTWKSKPLFTLTDNNLMVTHAGINDFSNQNDYRIKYRLKVYVYDKEALSSVLFGQSKSYDSVSPIVYNLPHTIESIELIPMLVCEISKNNKIEKILYFAGNSFNHSSTH